MKSKDNKNKLNQKHSFTALFLGLSMDTKLIYGSRTLASGHTTLDSHLWTYVDSVDS